jgi:molybdenum cofactor cytidylyltransferase
MDLCEQPTLSYGAIILAAGASSRMGRPKLLLPWGATSVLGHLIQQWQSVGAHQIGVVCASGDLGISSELTRLCFPAQNRIINPTPEQGMFSSIQCAARWPGWEPELSHWAFALGDQPHLRLQTLQALIEFGTRHADKICQPIRKGRRRHPVLFPRQALDRLRSAPQENLKQFLLTAPEELAFCDIDDPGLDLDIDLPSDYERAQELFEGHDPEKRRASSSQGENESKILKRV